MSRSQTGLSYSNIHTIYYCAVLIGSHMSNKYDKFVVASRLTKVPNQKVFFFELSEGNAKIQQPRGLWPNKRIFGGFHWLGGSWIGVKWGGHYSLSLALFPSFSHAALLWLIRGWVPFAWLLWDELGTNDRPVKHLDNSHKCKWHSWHIPFKGLGTILSCSTDWHFGQSLDKMELQTKSPQSNFHNSQTLGAQCRKYHADEARPSF